MTVTRRAFSLPEYLTVTRRAVSLQEYLTVTRRAVSLQEYMHIFLDRSVCRLVCKNLLEAKTVSEHSFARHSK